MKNFIWLLLSGGYWMAQGAARRWKSADAALCLFDGIFLALLCFAVLPLAMGTAFFYSATGCAAAGVAAGLLAEKRLSPNGWVRCLLFSGLSLAFWQLRNSQTQGLLFLAFWGGFALYQVTAAILPEEVSIRRAICSGSGFLLGILLFAPLL